MTYFYGSFLSAFIAAVIAYYLGGVSGLIVVTLLAILEISLSFDNAIVNAAVLRHWSDTWRKRFLWFGLPFAVFGMRLVFPVMIVAFATGLTMSEALTLALYDPARYLEALHAVHLQVAAFGSMFLALVAFEFFIDEEKKHHWLPWIEPLLSRLETYQKAVGVGLTLLMLLFAARFVQSDGQLGFIYAGVCGILTYIFVKCIGKMLGGTSDPSRVAEGVGGFLYLEVLDASFSFDGVIGAFAVTHQLALIVLGLGVGAFFVRSFTVYLTMQGTLQKYRYLEHGAFWAILFLAFVMLAGIVVPIPEAVTGLVGAMLIGLSLYSSYREQVGVVA